MRYINTFSINRLHNGQKTDTIIEKIAVKINYITVFLIF